MKDQYFGDINDYLKYGLLRLLGSGSGLALGVCWLRTPDDGRPDGEFRRYLSESARWRSFDPVLYDALRKLLDPGTPRVLEHAEDWGILPGAVFRHAHLSDHPHARAAYFVSAQSTLAASKLWFFDPDNGLEVPSKRFGTKNSSKFLYWHEVEGAFRAGKSVVIYQHFPREARASYTERRLAELRERTGASWAGGIATSRVLFLIGAQDVHAPQLTSAAIQATTHWEPHLKVVE